MEHVGGLSILKTIAVKMKSTEVQNPLPILPYLACIMPMRVRGNWARLRTRGLAFRARAAAGDQSEAIRMRTIYN